MYLNNVDLVDLPFVERAENSIYKVIIHKLKSIVSNYPNVFAFLKSLRLRNVDWSNPHYFQEKVKIDRLLDDAEKIVSAIDELRHSLRQMSDEDRITSMKYVQNLSKLANMYAMF